MTTPLTTIADALMDFIMSLLRDPVTAAQFDAEPEAVLASNGLSDACVADVRAVAPVIIERSDVHPVPPPPTPHPYPNDVIKEIHTITNHLTIDNRATIVDQSVNQNIWAKGDVTQIFDNEAIIASGDGSAAAGDDAGIDNSDTDVSIGDVAIGNETTDVVVTDSFNDEYTETDNSTEVEAEDSFNDNSTDVAVDVEVEDSFNYEEDTSIVNDVDVQYVDEEQP